MVLFLTFLNLILGIFISQEQFEPQRDILKADSLLAAGIYEIAIEKYIDILRVIDDVDTLQELAAQVNDKIGGFYNNHNQNFGLAETYYTEALEIRKSINSTAIWESYYNLAGNALRQGDFEATVKLVNRIRSFEPDPEIPEAVLIGVNYIECVALKQKYAPDYPDEVKNKLIRLFNEISNYYMGNGDTLYWAGSLLELSEILIEAEDPKKAIENLNAISSYEPIKKQRKYFTLLTLANEDIGDYKSALIANKELSQLLRNEAFENKIKDVAETTEDYRTDKQLDQAEETAFLASQRAKTYGIAALILLLILTVSYLIFLQTIQRKKLENLQAVVLGEEQERKRLAKDLHDGIGVLLTSIRMRLSSFEEKVDDQEAYHDSLEQIDNACTEVRRVSHNLSPASLENLGLEEALLDLVDQVKLSGDLEVKEEVSIEQGLLKTEDEVLVYRIVQELINNTLKYAEASKIELSLLKDSNDLRLSFNDNGKGFDQQKVKPGIGLKSIASRLDILKGKMNFNSQLGKGTHFEISIPIHV